MNQSKVNVVYLTDKPLKLKHQKMVDEILSTSLGVIPVVRLYLDHISSVILQKLYVELQMT